MIFCFSPVQHQRDQVICRKGANILAVERCQLVQIKPRSCLADAAQIKPFDGLLTADDLIIAMAPAQPQ